MHSINTILLGAIAMASATIGLFFLRFWKSTKDRFFLFFGASFLIEGCNRIFMGLRFHAGINETSPIYYWIRLVTYALILLAIFDKNLKRTKKE
ncbi:MAG: DUF5985 family protein [Gallionella sp.]